MRGRTILACSSRGGHHGIGNTRRSGAANKSGFKTEQAVDAHRRQGRCRHHAADRREVATSGYRFEAIPDGISVRTRGTGRWTCREPRDQQGAVPLHGRTHRGQWRERLRQRAGEPLVLNQHSAGVLSGKFVIPSSFGSSASAPATWRPRGRASAAASSSRTRSRPTTCSGRRTRGLRRSATRPSARPAWSSRSTSRTGKQHPIYGMGRHNHENTVAIPGYGHPVVLSGDDTFTSGPLTGSAALEAHVPAQSQLYSYIAPSTDALLADEGDLWAFVSDTPGVKNYYDVAPGPHGGHRPLHQGAEGHRHRPQPRWLGAEAADKGYPPPPNNVSNWQTDLLRDSGRHRRPPVGARALERPQQRVPVRPRRGHRLRQAARHGERRVHRRLRPGPDGGPSLDTPFRSTNGRVWKMVLDPSDPTKVTSLTVFVEGDDNPVKTLNEIHQPDNLETTPNGLLVTEDPGSSQQFPPAPGPPTRRRRGSGTSRSRSRRP